MVQTSVTHAEHRLAIFVTYRWLIDQGSVDCSQRNREGHARCSMDKLLRQQVPRPGLRVLGIGLMSSMMATQMMAVIGAPSLPANSTWSATDLGIAAIAVIATSTENAAAAEERNSESKKS